MINPPKTLQEAEKTKYGEFFGGKKYISGRCAYRVYETDDVHSYQCKRKKGYGINELYCKQHARIVGE